jgi:hypothetical protein
MQPQIHQPVMHHDKDQYVCNRIPTGTIRQPLLHRHDTTQAHTNLTGSNCISARQKPIKFQGSMQYYMHSPIYGPHLHREHAEADEFQHNQASQLQHSMIWHTDANFSFSNMTILAQSTYWPCPFSELLQKSQTLRMPSMQNMELPNPSFWNVTKLQCWLEHYLLNLTPRSRKSKRTMQ